MGKRNNQLKMLANIAKKRLMTGNYQEPEQKDSFAPKVSSYFIKNASAMKKITAKIEYIKISGEIDEEFREKVFDILNEDYYDLNPFAKLIDSNKYNTLTEIEKQSYVLSIAEKYNSIKDNYDVKEKQAM